MTPRRRRWTFSDRVWTTMPSATGVVHEAGVPARPSISTRQSRQEPKGSSESVAQSFGIAVPMLIAAAITEVPGSSAWFREGFVTYAAEAKTSLLDVDPKMIEEEGVVSEDVAQAMARGALARCPDSTLAVAVTGVAGPTGGTHLTPVGTVCIGWAERFNEHIVTYVRTIHAHGSRSMVRRATVLTALEGLIELMRFGNPAVMPCEY